MTQAPLTVGRCNRSKAGSQSYQLCPAYRQLMALLLKAAGINHETQQHDWESRIRQAAQKDHKLKRDNGDTLSCRAIPNSLRRFERERRKHKCSKANAEVQELAQQIFCKSLSACRPMRRRSLLRGWPHGSRRRPSKIESDFSSGLRSLPLPPLNDGEHVANVSEILGDRLLWHISLQAVKHPRGAERPRRCDRAARLSATRTSWHPPSRWPRVAPP